MNQSEPAPRVPAGSRIPGMLVNFLVLAVSTFIALGAVEFVLRAVNPALLGETHKHAHFCAYDAQLGWVNRPGASGLFMTPNFTTRVHNNSKRLRGREYPYERTPGKKRVLVLGDSFTWGHGVEESERFTELLEKRWPGVEVINAGVSGYGTDQEYLYFKDEGVRYAPDLVIVIVHPFSDLSNSTSSNQYGYEKPCFRRNESGEVVLTNVPVPNHTAGKRVDLFLRGRSALWNWLHRRHLFGERDIAQVFVDWLDERFGTPPRKTQSNIPEREMMSFLVDRISGTAASINAKTLFVLVPEVYQPENYLHDAELNSVLGDFQAKRVAHINLAECFIPHLGPANPPLTFLGDSHWTVQGNLLVADFIDRYIREHPEFDIP